MGAEKTLFQIAFFDSLPNNLKSAPPRKSGHSRQLSSWVRGGLKYAEKSGRRYFMEQDVIDYLWSGYQRGDVEE